MSGRRCPKCNHTKIHVVESSPSHQKETRRIRRRCINCDHSWTIYEIERETLDYYREIKQKYDYIKSFMLRDETSTTCNDCHQFVDGKCSLDIPEAGGTFATECSYFYKA